MHSCSYQLGRVFCSILCVYCFFTRSVNELSFGSMWCWKKGCTEENSLAFLMGNCGLFLECINILILFTFFLQKYLTPTSLLPQTTQHFWLCSFLTLREIQRISFTQLISMVAIFSLAFRKPFSFSNFFYLEQKKIKVFWFHRLFFTFFLLYELNRSGATLSFLWTKIVFKVSQNKSQWVEHQKNEKLVNKSSGAKKWRLPFCSQLWQK